MFQFHTNPICPFAHRSWFVIKEKNLPHEFRLVPLSGEISLAEKQGIEQLEQWKNSTVDQLKQLKEEYKATVNPSGEVPAIVLQDGRILSESDIVSEYLDAAYQNQGTRLMPEDPFDQARIRLALKGFGNTIPLFYQLLSNQDPAQDQVIADKISAGLKKLQSQLDVNGPYFLGQNLSLVEINVAPFLFRMQLLLEHYRKFSMIPDNEEFKRLRQYYNAVTDLQSFKDSSPSVELIYQSYLAYAHGQKWEGNQLKGRGVSVEFGK